MLAIIGGTGLSELDCFESLGSELIPTPYSKQDVRVLLCQHHLQKFAFLPRHGKDHKVPPHRINYRANIWALHQLSMTNIIAVNAVGGIHGELGPGTFAVPNQIIDYSSGREATFHDQDVNGVRHIDFTAPYDQRLRDILLNVCSNGKLPGTKVVDGGVYGCTNGPRLETAAEIERMRRDGCDMVGMTGMPEAALAREAGIAYATLALSVNWAAGIGADVITMDEIQRVLDTGVGQIKSILKAVVSETGN